MSFVATENEAGGWTLSKETGPSSSLTIAENLDALQANVCADILNGNEQLEFDNEGQCVIYTGYQFARDQDGEAISYEPFEPEGDPL